MKWVEMKVVAMKVVTKNLVAFLLGLLIAAVAVAQERVISTDPGITGIVDALGVSQRLVGIDVTSTAPAGREALPRVGYHRSLSAEGLLSLNPDLILASSHAGPPETLLALERVGVPVVTLNTPLDLDGLLLNISQIGTALEQSDAAEALVERLRQQAGAPVASKAPAPPALLLRESNGALRVAGEGTAAAALLSLGGFTNAVDFDGYRSYSPESLLAVDPQVLLVAVSEGQSPDDVMSRFPQLDFLSAVRQDRVTAVPGSALVGGLSLATLQEARRLQASPDLLGAPTQRLAATDTE